MSDFHPIMEPEDKMGGLFLGNYRCASDYEVLKTSKLTVVLDVAGANHAYPKDTLVGHKVIKADDAEDFDLSQFFFECFAFIDEHRSKGHNVLVHCMAGISRSATIVIAYLMFTKSIDLWQAHDDVRRIRNVIKPNRGFMNQLRKFEKEMRQKEYQEN